MELDESIIYFRKLADSRRTKAMHSSIDSGWFIGCKKCAEKYDQFAKWLEELKAYKDIGTVQGYKDAIKAYNEEYNLRKELSNELGKYSERFKQENESR